MAPAGLFPWRPSSVGAVRQRRSLMYRGAQAGRSLAPSGRGRKVGVRFPPALSFSTPALDADLPLQGPARGTPGTRAGRRRVELAALAGCGSFVVEETKPPRSTPFRKHRPGGRVCQIRTTVASVCRVGAAGRRARAGASLEPMLETGRNRIAVGGPPSGEGLSACTPVAVSATFIMAFLPRRLGAFRRISQHDPTVAEFQTAEGKTPRFPQ